jgi:uncharacterized protein (TIGR04255 family)
MKKAVLPDYDSPPAIETLMGFHFAHYANFNVLHLGKLWALFERKYPKGQLVPPIIDPSQVMQGAVDLAQMPFRAMFTDSADSELVQVQPSLFLRNWRKTSENISYTHYKDLKPKFESDWATFTSFLASNGLPQPRVFQTEVTYVNHLVRGVLWESYGDLPKLLKPFAPRSGVKENGRHYEFLPAASGVSLNLVYNLNDSGVTLQISCNSAVRNDGFEVIQLTVSAKADTSRPGNSSIWEMLDRCHDSVILGFDDITTDEAHAKWGKQ